MMNENSVELLVILSFYSLISYMQGDHFLFLYVIKD